MSSSEHEIYEKLLKIGFSEKDLQKEMEKKAKEFGGYVSEQAILFILAKENGININALELENREYEDYQESMDEIDYDEFSINISELEEGMQKVVLMGKILKVFAPREFVRKDGSIGRVGSFYIIDTTGEVKIVVWNEKTECLNNEYFTSDQLIRIIGGFTKSNKDGILEVHLGNKSEIILAPQDIPMSKKKELNAVSKKQKKLETQRKNTMQLYDLISRYNYIRKILGYIKVENFHEITKKNGEKTFLLKCILSDNSMSIRLVVWGMNAVQMFKLIQDGDYVLLQNLMVKENSYTEEKELIYTQKSSLDVL